MVRRLERQQRESENPEQIKNGENKRKNYANVRNLPESRSNLCDCSGKIIALFLLSPLFPVVPET